MYTSLHTSNRSVVWAGPRKLEIRQKDVKPPDVDEVLVEVIATGICGSDCHNWESDKVSRQLVLGHESAGIIIQLGQNVRDRTIGQRVAIEPGFSCMEYVRFHCKSKLEENTDDKDIRCEFCDRGQQNICANLEYCGMDPTDGTLCQYFTCKVSNTVPIPEGVSWEEAGAIQPLAIAVQVARRATFNPHQTVAIL